MTRNSLHGHFSEAKNLRDHIPDIFWEKKKNLQDHIREIFRDKKTFGTAEPNFFCNKKVRYLRNRRTGPVLYDFTFLAYTSCMSPFRATDLQIYTDSLFFYPCPSVLSTSKKKKIMERSSIGLILSIIARIELKKKGF